jgi:hypothetical protein
MHACARRIFELDITTRDAPQVQKNLRKVFSEDITEYLDFQHHIEGCSRKGAFFS